MSRGPQTQCRLQKPTEERTAAGGGTDTWEDLVEFPGVLIDLTASEAELFARETVVSTHKLLVSPAFIRKDNIAEVKEENRISVLNAENLQVPQLFDITMVRTVKRGRGKIIQFQLILREVI